jgi:hypothetical protein
MRQTHRAGEKLFVDYAGQSIPVVNRHSGEVHDNPRQNILYSSAEINRLEAAPEWPRELPPRGERNFLITHCL